MIPFLFSASSAPLWCFTSDWIYAPESRLMKRRDHMDLFHPGTSRVARFGATSLKPLLLALLAISAPGAVPVQPIANLQPITITVLDAQNNRPVAGAVVTIPAMPNFALLSATLVTNASRAVTDQRGVAVMTFSRPTAMNLLITVEHTNYVSRQAQWYPDNGRPSSPASYTFKLERGITVGGFIRDEKGQPIAGTLVVPWTDASNPGNQPRVQQENPFLPHDDRSGTMTDANGFWSRPNFPTDLDRFRIDVIRPAGARTPFATEAARTTYGEATLEARIADLRATNAVLTVSEGVTIRGIVVDTQGRAIPNAHLKERRGRSYQLPIYEFTNNADGRFDLPHRVHAQWLLTAEAPGFAAKSTIVKSTESLEARIVMSPAKPLRLRVVGENNEPVPSQVQFLQWRSVQSQLLEWNVQTDSEGRTVWTNAPNDAVTLSIQPINYPYRTVTLTADGTEKLVRLRKQRDASISVKAVDATTGKPVTKFQVWRNVQYNNGFFLWGEPSEKSGQFQTNLLASDLQRGPGMLRVQVRADDYAPWTSAETSFNEGDQDFVAMLTNAPPPAGVVLQPDGSPAAGAKLVLNTGDDTLFIHNPADNLLARPGMHWVMSDSNGYFRLPPAEPANRILARHATGFASTTVEELLKSPIPSGRESREIRLQAWGRVEGILRPGGKPLPNERLCAKSPINWVNLDGYGVNVMTTTDTNGAFTFTNLPPGEYMFYRLPVMISGVTHSESHPWPFELAAGETKKIDYNFGGRTVVGHVEAGADVDWQNDPYLLTLKLPPSPAAPNFYDFVDMKDYEQARKAHGKSAAVKEYDRKRRQFQLVFDRDGNFKADDVTPGIYELRLRATRPPKDPNMRYQRQEEELGSLVKEVTIPPGAPGEEFDLGSFEMESKGLKIAVRPLSEFQAVTLDGKPFNLSILRGKPAVLLFWANWAPKSAARLLDLKTLQESTNAPVSFVTVNLDEDGMLANSAVRDFKGGIHTRLEGRARFDVTEQSDIDSLPTTLVLDEQGRIIARDLQGNRLRTTLERAAAKLVKR